MSAPLVLPSVPRIISDYDISNRVEIASPDTSIVKNITVVLTGQDKVMNKFKTSNEKAWR